MLEGITVLSETVHQFNISDEIGLIFVSLFLAAFLTLPLAIESDNGYLILGVWTILSIILVITFNNISDRNTYNIYKVTISEEVNFVEFTDRYEILSQEGQIYEIREKETE